jgi:hypothetical protein
MQPSSKRWGAAALLVGGAAFGAAFLAFLLERSAIAAVNGWWQDELYAIYASDPAEPLSVVFLGRIWPDTTPPLYGLLLYAARALVHDDRWAVFVLNTGAILVAVGAVMVSGRRAGIAGLALAASIAFLLSGPVVRFASEARPYALAIAVAFAASWLSALAIQAPHARPSKIGFAMIGIIGALTHIYAALLCGSFAVALIALAVVWRRSDLMAAGLTLGISASVVFVIWLALWLPSASLERLYWMKFSYETVIAALWEAKQLAIGPHLLAALAALLAFGLLWPATRMLTSAFCIAFAVFLAVPLVVSLWQPIIFGRYWVQGAPALVVLLAFLAKTWLLDHIGRSSRLVSITGALAAIGLLAISDAAGFMTARAFTAAKPAWKGAAVVVPLVRNCPAASVHVNGFVPFFAYAARAPDAVFADIREPTTKPISAANMACPVLGWAEEPHPADFMRRATDGDVMELMKIEASPPEVEIWRHRTGFVILQRGG